MNNWDMARWRRMQELFERAIELDANGREAILREVGTDDPALAAEVRGMLAADAAQDDAPLPNAVHALQGWLDDRLPPGTRLGPYVICEVIGSGGMGHVYRAEREDGTAGQTVAVKCLRGGTGLASLQRRFLRERRILARLQHPNIARFLDAGSDEHGRPYVVMEYVAGVSITQWCAQQQLGLAARIALLLQVMDAVTYSHRQTIVHRDIKPGNVVMAADGEPRLLDFGIAKQRASPNADPLASTQTEPMSRYFSLAYCAPEQLRGADSDTAIDVHALGLLAYELLAGVPAFVLDGLSYTESEHKLLYTLPIAPSARVRGTARAPDGRDVRAWAHQLDGDLDRIVLHALRKEPASRYATVDAFAADLRRVLACEPISLRSSHRRYRAQLFVARHRVACVMAAALGLVLVVGSTALAWQAHGLAKQRDIAKVQQQRAQATTKILLDAISSSDPSNTRGEQLTAHDVADNVSRQVQLRSDLDAATRAELLSQLARVQMSLGDLKQAGTLAQSAYALSAEHGDRRIAITAALALGHAQAEASKIGVADALYRETLDLLEVAGSDVETEALRAHTAMLGAHLAVAQNDLKLAQERTEAAYARARERIGTSHPVVLELGAELIHRLQIRNEHERVATLTQELLTQMTGLDLDPVGLRVLRGIAMSERKAGRFEQAVVAAERARVGTLRLYGGDHLSYLSALDTLARIEGSATGHTDRARARFAEAIALAERIARVGRARGRHGAILNNAANFELRQGPGRAEAALAHARSAVAVGAEVMAPTDIPFGHFRWTLSEALLATGKFAEAEVELRAVGALWDLHVAQATDGNDRAIQHAQLARALHGQGRDEPARAELVLALPTFAKFSADDAHRIAGERLAQELGLSRVKDDNAKSQATQ